MHDNHIPQPLSVLTKQQQAFDGCYMLPSVRLAWPTFQMVIHLFDVLDHQSQGKHGHLQLQANEWTYTSTHLQSHCPRGID